MGCLHDICPERPGKHLFLSRETWEENRESVLLEGLVSHDHALSRVPLLCDIYRRNIPLNTSPRHVFERRGDFTH